MDTPSLFKEKTGSSKTKVLIYIPGMCTEDNLGLDDEIKHAILEARWTGDIYYLWWDSSTLGKFIVEYALRLPLGWILISKFKQTQVIAQRTGREYLSNLIRSLAPQRKVTFIAHSLGAYMLYDLFSKPHEYPFHNRIDDVILLGGALSELNKNWQRTKFRSLINVFNPDDTILRLLWPIGKTADGEIPISPYGRKAIKADVLSGNMNIDVSHVVGGSHFEYHKVFSRGILKYRRQKWVL